MTIRDITITTFFWLVVVPFGAYLLNGMKTGLMLTCIYTLISVFIIHWRFESSGYDLHFETIFNILGSISTLWLLTHLYEKLNISSQKKLMDIALKDSLTQIYNRHAFYEIYEDLSKENVALIMLDLDWFKSINDCYGHNAGDKVLKDVAKLIKQHIPSEANIFRMGGEEFSVLLPNYNDTQTLEVANKLLTVINSNDISYKHDVIKVTASIGIAIKDSTTISLENLMRQADKNLYKAKDNGRNCIIFEKNEL